MIVISDSSPLITLARVGHLELLHEFYGTVTIPRQVHEEVVVAGAGMPGAEEVRKAAWIRTNSLALDPSAEMKSACAGLGAGERNVIYLASAIKADLVLMDEERARRVARSAGLTIAGSIAILERGARLELVTDLRAVYLNLLNQGIRFDSRLLEASLARLGLAKLKP